MTRHALLVATLLLPLVPAALAAQGARGRVLDASTDAPLEGVVITALRADGGRGGVALTGADGSYALRLPEGSRVRLVAEMVGFRTAQGAPVTVVGTVWLPLDLRLARDDRLLDEITTTASAVCVDRGDTLGLTGRLWSEARKALQATALLDDERPLRARTTLTERLFGADDGRLVAERRRYAERSTARPFRALPANQLVQLGFAEFGSHSAAYYAPDAEVLLSDAFAAEHCFGLALPTAADSGGNVVGLSWRPKREREGVVGVRGTLWLDRDGLELRRLDFTYVGIPSLKPDPRFGGRVSFRRLPTGYWIVDDWAVKMPIFGLGDPKLLLTTKLLEGAGASLGPTLVAVKEEGGAVLQVAPTDSTGGVGPDEWAELPGSRSTTVEGCPPVDSTRTNVAGELVDARGRPVADGAVQLAWRDGVKVESWEVFRYGDQFGRLRTDAQGRFAVCGVPVRRRLSVWAEGPGFRRAWRELRTEGDAVTRLRVALPR
ncbi:MAG: carboxypeptidase regulatory-like domain-containing protein [Gemmatimonadales bacterium]|nr:carboxypeptidase regulatory-like domain-containing protein [Gemmatimonadales bacterium]